MSTRDKGEGDRESGRRYNRRTRDFLKSRKGRESIARVRRGLSESEPEDALAEQKGRARAREKDPAEKRDYHKPDR
jgi:hypothetical protein